MFSRIHKGFLCICLFFFCLFCVLGVWQLHRFQFKKMLVQNEQSGIHFIVVEGEYLNDQTMFVQNRFNHGKQGFEVLTPLKIAGEKKLLLVNRGWVAEGDKHTVPVIQKVPGQLTILGYKKQLNEYQFILGKNILYPAARPVVMQKIDISELNHLTAQVFYPFIIRLDPKAEHGFVREWIISTVPPERHRMYAVQWFAFALILVIAYLGFCWQSVRNPHDKKS